MPTRCLPPRYTACLPNCTADVTLPAGGHLEIKGNASDDFGVARLELCLQVVGGQKLKPYPYLAEKLRSMRVSFPWRSRIDAVSFPPATLSGCASGNSQTPGAVSRNFAAKFFPSEAGSPPCPLDQHRQRNRVADGRYAHR